MVLKDFWPFLEYSALIIPEDFFKVFGGFKHFLLSRQLLVPHSSCREGNMCLGWPSTGHVVPVAASAGCSPFPQKWMGGGVAKAEQSSGPVEGRKGGPASGSGTDLQGDRLFCLCASGDQTRCRKTNSSKRIASPRPLALNLYFCSN